MSMKVLVTGAKGQLGTDLMNELKRQGLEGVGVDVEEMDITDAAACRRVISQANVDAVIHCAAYTAVDAAEDNVELCRKINGYGTRNVAEACRKAGVKLMYISTDYVFDGQGSRPWEPDDEREPLNVYGQTKYEGELAVETLELTASILGKSNDSAASDLGVSALSLRAAIQGAWLNVLINVGSLRDRAFADRALARGRAVRDRARPLADNIYQAITDALQ